MSLDVYLTCPCCNNSVYSGNVTHNLGKMADEAGLYKCMWRPEEIGITTAKDLIPLLQDGITELVFRPIHYKKFNPENGWGTYDALLEIASHYLQACKDYPTAKVRASR